jgi:hypothetical protein
MCENKRPPSVSEYVSSRGSGERVRVRKRERERERVKLCL